jgi:hypothetical protein
MLAAVVGADSSNIGELADAAIRGWRWSFEYPWRKARSG